MVSVSVAVGWNSSKKSDTPSVWVTVFVTVVGATVTVFGTFSVSVIVVSASVSIIGR